MVIRHTRLPGKHATTRQGCRLSHCYWSKWKTEGNPKTWPTGERLSFKTWMVITGKAEAACRKSRSAMTLINFPTICKQDWEMGVRSWNKPKTEFAETASTVAFQGPVQSCNHEWKPLQMGDFHWQGRASSLLPPHLRFHKNLSRYSRTQPSAQPSWFPPLTQRGTPSLQKKIRWKVALGSWNGLKWK